jgi:RNA polymerase sigma-70 factor (ECF subfamily)
MEDEELVARFLGTGDRAAFSVLVERYRDRVFRLAASVLGPYASEDAEEVAQEVFIRVYGELRRFRGKARFNTWLYRVAYNLAIDRKRRERRQALRAAFEGQCFSDGPQQPIDGLLSKEKKALVAAAIEGLPELYRTIVYMHYWLEQPVEEVACALRLPEGTVKSYLFRARRLLRDKLETALGPEATGGGAP